MRRHRLGVKDVETGVAFPKLFVVISKFKKKTEGMNFVKNMFLNIKFVLFIISTKGGIILMQVFFICKVL